MPLARTGSILAALFCLLLSAGCANLGPGISGTPCPVAWVPSQEITTAAGARRARMQMKIGSEEVHLELISESRPGELVVVALARFGVRLFAIHQRGTEVIVEGATTRELEQLAIWVMDALHRVYWIEAPHPGPDEATWTRAGEAISQRRRNGGLYREFSLSGQGDTGISAATDRVAIEYLRTDLGSTESMDSSHWTASIRNPWCGYEAVLVSVLPPANQSL